LAEVLFVDGKPAEAEPLLREALAIRQAIGRDSQGASVLVEVLAQVLAAEGKFEEAEALIREEISSEKQSNYQDALVHSLRILGVVLCLPGKLPDAEAVLREDLEMMIKEFGKGHRLYATVLTDLGDNLQQQGKFAESAVLLREALDLHRQGRQGARLGPTSCVRRLVGVLMADDKPAAVGHLCNELNSGSSTNVRLAAIAMWARGDFFARRGRWSEAEADLARALELNPGSPTWHRVAAVLVQHGKLDAYKAHCREGLERFRNTTNSENAQRIAMSCLVLSGSGADLEVVNEMVNAAAATDTNAFSSVPFLVAKGLAEFRQGHFANAADWLKKALARPAETQWSWGSWIPVQAWAILAMAQWQLREGNIAQVSLAKAMEIERRESVKLWAADFGNDPTDRVFAQSLLRQAQALIERKNE
jgi:tetratricopeptide (TPR) repeat protein